MGQTKIANKFGKIAGWNDVTFTIHGRTFEGISEIMYDDNVKLENVYGAGGDPIGFEEGNYEAKGSITLLSEELVGLQAALPSGKRIQDLEGTAVVKYEYNSLITADVLNVVKFKNNGREVKQGDGKIYTKFDLYIGTIEWSKKP